MNFLNIMDNSCYLSIRDTIDESLLNWGTAQESKYGQFITIHYNGKDMFIKTDTQECPQGFNYQTDTVNLRLKCQLSDYVFQTLNTLKEMAMRHLNIITDQDADNPDISNYHEFSISNTCQIFDQNFQNITEKRNDHMYNGRFTAKLLLHIKGINVSNNKCKLVISIIQIRIMEISKLPPGCIMFYSEESLLKYLSDTNSQNIC